MKEFAPNYYTSFSCIADRCRHSCCVGWEIDIDEDSLEYYRSIAGEFGKRLRDHIEETEDGAHFCLDADERCPFLNDCGLCDLYATLGEEALCQICTDHPRFRNEFSCRTEIGVGLCCEAAAKLILEQSEPLSLVSLYDDGEEAEDEEWEAVLFAKREQIFATLYSAESEKAAADQICPKGSAFMKSQDWASILMELERLDPAWEEPIGWLENAPQSVWEREIPHLDRAFRNLFGYFIYRHASGAQSLFDMEIRLGFAYLSLGVLRALCAMKMQRQGECTLLDLCELARMYSSEIEYSIDNTDALMMLWEENA